MSHPQDTDALYLCSHYLCSHCKEWHYTGSYFECPFEDPAVREDAAQILSAVCSTKSLEATYDAEHHFFGEYGTLAGEVARSALGHVNGFDGCLAYAEAEAMLRTGWMP